jgi:hypothetical protein
VRPRRLPGSGIEAYEGKGDENAEQHGQEHAVDGVRGGSGGPRKIRLNAGGQEPVVKVRMSAPASGQDGGDQVVFIKTG